MHGQEFDFFARSFLGGNVADQSDEQAAVVAFDFGDREVHRENVAIAAAALDLAADADDMRGLFGLVAGQVAVVLVPVRLRHQHLDILADDLGGTVAEDFFGGLVEGLDEAAFVDRNDAFKDIIEDAEQAVLNQFDPLHHVDSRLQDGKVDRLGQIIVGAGLQSGHHFLGAIQRGNQQ